jgi:hypothetical protein
MKKKISCFIVSIMMIFSSMAFIVPVQASELPIEDQSVVIVNSFETYPFSKSVSAGSSFTIDYWTGTNQLLDVGFNPVSGASSSLINATLTNFSTGELLDSSGMYADGSDSMGLFAEGVGGYIRLKVTNRSSKTLTITGQSYINTIN